MERREARVRPTVPPPIIRTEWVGGIDGRDGWDGWDGWDGRDGRDGR